MMTTISHEAIHLLAEGLVGCVEDQSLCDVTLLSQSLFTHHDVCNGRGDVAPDGVHPYPFLISPNCVWTICSDESEGDDDKCAAIGGC